MADDGKGDKVDKVVDLLKWLKEDLSRKSDPQKLTEESEAMIRERFVWKDEFQDIMWVFHGHLREHNYGLLHRAIHDMLDHYECEQPPDA
jgi:hypothetical protein